MDGRGLRLRSVRARYGFAVLAVAAAVILQTLWLQLVPESSMAPFLAAILITGWYAGTGPVVAATTVSIAAFILFVPDQAVALSWAFAVRLGWFAGFAGLAAWFGAARGRARDALERERSALEERVAGRTAELRRSEELLLAAQRLSQTGSFSWRLDTGEAVWSEECRRIFGLGPGPRTFSRRRLRRSRIPTTGSTLSAYGRRPSAKNADTNGRRA